MNPTHRLRPVATESGASTQHTPAVRAHQLADVALALYERGGPGIHVPLDCSHALVAVLKAALEREAKERSGKQWKVRETPCMLTHDCQRHGLKSRMQAQISSIASKDASVVLCCVCCALVDKVCIPASERSQFKWAM